MYFLLICQVEPHEIFLMWSTIYLENVKSNYLFEIKISKIQRRVSAYEEG